MSDSFQQMLARGRAGESVVALWLRRRGWDVLPVYEKAFDDHKGPRFFMATGERVAPDLLIMRPGEFHWVEVKRKTSFAWNRKRRLWVTGIDRHHFADYLRIAERYPALWLLFLHESSACKDKPDTPCPTGLFGGPIGRLAERISHEDSRHGKHGMVYWEEPDLYRVAELPDLYPESPAPASYIVTLNTGAYQRYWTGTTWPELGDAPAWTGNYACIHPSGFFATREAAALAVARIPTFPTEHVAILHMDELELGPMPQPWEGMEPLTWWPWQRGGSGAG